jgi:transcriptional regulator with XRE-family HTH domain
MINKRDLGFRITEKRKRLEMSQSQLGEMLGVSHAAVSDIERGVTNLNVESISKIADILKTTFEDLTFVNDYGTNMQSFNPSNGSILSGYRLGKYANSDDLKEADKKIEERLAQLRKERNDSQ